MMLYLYLAVLWNEKKNIEGFGKAVTEWLQLIILKCYFQFSAKLMYLTQTTLKSMDTCYEKASVV